MTKITEKLDEINQTLEKMLVTMQKPGNRFIRLLEIFALCGGAMTILSSIELVRQWFFGG